MLWKFFSQALVSPHVNFDSAFREMLRLAKCDVRPFAAENAPSPAAAASASGPVATGGVTNRGRKRCRSGLGLEKRNIKTVGIDGKLDEWVLVDACLKCFVRTCCHAHPSNRVRFFLSLL